MGLPGSGKTFLASALKDRLIDSNKTVDWFNADDIRRRYDDWDFSTDGRIRQSVRMAQLANESVSDFVIADFVAPLIKMRENFNSDYTIWVDTIDKSRYPDTNIAFIPPTTYDFRVTEQNSDHWASIIANSILRDRCWL